MESDAIDVTVAIQAPGYGHPLALSNADASKVVDEHESDAILFFGILQASYFTRRMALRTL
jgi:hypothetical protein